MQNETDIPPKFQGVNSARFCVGEKCWDAPFDWAQIRADLVAAQEVRTEEFLAKIGMTREEANQWFAEHMQGMSDAE